MEFLGSLIECYCRRSVDMNFSITYVKNFYTKRVFNKALNFWT